MAYISSPNSDYKIPFWGVREKRENLAQGRLCYVLYVVSLVCKRWSSYSLY